MEKGKCEWRAWVTVRESLVPGSSLLLKDRALFPAPGAAVLPAGLDTYTPPSHDKAGYPWSPRRRALHPRRVGEGLASIWS